MRPPVLESTAYNRLFLALMALLAGLMCIHAFGEDTKDAQPGAANPQMQAVLDELKSLDGKPIEMLDAAEARKQPTMADAAKSLIKKQNKPNKPEPVAHIDNTTLNSQPKGIPVRIYTPMGDGPFPVVVYYHGGGFVIATLDTYDASCRALCNAAGAVVVSVDYRQAPENKYPAAVDDSFAAYQWVVNNAGSIRGDPRKIAVAGESAGGNLATVVSMMAVEKNVQKPVFQVLIYPVVDNNLSTPSYKTYADAKPLNKAMMPWFFNNYLDNDKSGGDPHVSPLKAKEADLAKLEPALIIAAQIDPLLSEGKAYADKLKAAGVPVEYKLYDGVTHEFFGLGAVVDTAKMAEADAGAALKAAFAK